MAFKVFLDANVILGYVLKRDDYIQAKALFELEQELKIKFYMSSSVVHIIGYFLTKFIHVIPGDSVLINRRKKFAYLL